MFLKYCVKYFLKQQILSQDKLSVDAQKCRNMDFEMFR